MRTCLRKKVFFPFKIQYVTYLFSVFQMLSGMKILRFGGKSFKSELPLFRVKHTVYSAISFFFFFWLGLTPVTCD